MRIVSSILITFFLITFNLPDYHGNYEYKSHHLTERLELSENYTFIYYRRSHFFNIVIKGNYNIVGDSLILNSSPQRDKMIVRERYIKKFETKFFNLTNKLGENITYRLYLTFNDGSKKDFIDNFGKIKFKSKPIKSFHVFTTMGIKSPEYELLGTNTNDFEIQLETSRVFDNEKWFIDKVNGKITPKGLDGEIQNYVLEKK